MRRRFASAAAGGAIAGLVLLAACGASFEPSHKVQSIRILAAAADKPYAKPGDQVTVDLLAYDGRAEQPEPMQLSWLPFVCVNPPGDLYYACFLALLGTDAGATRIGADSSIPADAGGDAGRGISAGDIVSRLTPGTDLTPFLVKGSKFSFKIPDDIVDKHPPVQGAGEPYGLAIVFNVACAGRVVLAEIDPSKGPQQVPVACVDKSGNPVGPNDWVFGFTRVYSYKSDTNANPVIDGLTFDGKPVDLAKGIVVERCKADKTRDCEEHKLDTKVPPSSWEESRIGVKPGDPPRHEQIWVSYYMTTGDVSDGARLLYDVNQGAVSETETKFQSPGFPIEGTMWAVVRDNRGGTAWRQFPLKVQEDKPAE